MGKVGVLTKNWRIFQSLRGIDSTQSGMESGIFSPAYHTKFHSRTKIPLCVFTYCTVRIAKSWSSICATAPHWWHFVAPHNDAAISSVHPHNDAAISRISAATTHNSLTKALQYIIHACRPFVTRVSWSAYCGHFSGEFLCPPSNDETPVQMMLFLFG
jgi:hypothetical protein